MFPSPVSFAPVGCGSGVTAPAPRGELVSGQGAPHTAAPRAPTSPTPLHSRRTRPARGVVFVAPGPRRQPPRLPRSACCPRRAHTARPCGSHISQCACCPFGGSRHPRGARCCSSGPGPQWRAAGLRVNPSQRTQPPARSWESPACHRVPTAGDAAERPGPVSRGGLYVIEFLHSWGGFWAKVEIPSRSLPQVGSEGRAQHPGDAADTGRGAPGGVGP